MRIDRLLYNLRFLRTRTLAAELVRTGHLRRNGLRVTKPSQEIVVGDVLTIPLGIGIRLIEVLALPERRGSAQVAQGCYRALEPSLDRARQTDIGGGNLTASQGDARP